MAKQKVYLDQQHLRRRPVKRKTMYHGKTWALKSKDNVCILPKGMLRPPQVSGQEGFWLLGLGPYSQAPLQLYVVATKIYVLGVAGIDPTLRLSDFMMGFQPCPPAKTFPINPKSITVQLNHSNPKSLILYTSSHDAFAQALQLHSRVPGTPQVIAFKASSQL